MNGQTNFRPQFGGNAIIHTLGLRGGAPPVQAIVAEATGRQLHLTCATPLRPGTPVRLDVDGGLVLGEIAAAEPYQNGWRAVVVIDQVIPSVSDLAHLVQSVIGQRSRQEYPERRTSSAR